MLKTGQGAVLSGFLFNILIHGLAAAVKRSCYGFSFGFNDSNARMKSLLFAADVVVFLQLLPCLSEGSCVAPNEAIHLLNHLTLEETMVITCLDARTQNGNLFVLVGVRKLPTFACGATVSRDRSRGGEVPRFFAVSARVLPSPRSPDCFLTERANGSPSARR